MGLDMMLYKYPKVDLPLKTIRASDDFVNNVCNDLPNMFESWYNLYDSYIPTMKIISDLLKICPEGDFYEEVGYWRKANAIHKWFVDKCSSRRGRRGSYNRRYIPVRETPNWEEESEE